jgi:hypothetical protein
MDDELERMGRKWSWTNLRYSYYLGICLEGLGRSLKISVRIFGGPIKIQTGPY